MVLRNLLETLGQHNSNYNDLKYKKNYREAKEQDKLKVNGEFRR